MAKGIGERLVEQTILTFFREFTRDAAKKVKEVLKKRGKKNKSGNEVEQLNPDEV